MFGQKGDEGPRGFPGLPGPVGLQASWHQFTLYSHTHQLLLLLFVLVLFCSYSLNTWQPDHVEHSRAGSPSISALSKASADSASASSFLTFTLHQRQQNLLQQPRLLITVLLRGNNASPPPTSRDFLHRQWWKSISGANVVHLALSQGSSDEGRRPLAFFFFFFFSTLTAILPCAETASPQSSQARPAAAVFYCISVFSFFCK